MVPPRRGSGVRSNVDMPSGRCKSEFLFFGGRGRFSTWIPPQDPLAIASSHGSSSWVPGGKIETS